MARSYGATKKRSGSNSNPLPHWALLSLLPLPYPEWQQRLWPLPVPGVGAQCFFLFRYPGWEEGVMIRDMRRGVPEDSGTVVGTASGRRNTSSSAVGMFVGKEPVGGHLCPGGPGELGCWESQQLATGLRVSFQLLRSQDQAWLPAPRLQAACLEGMCG